MRIIREKGFEKDCVITSQSYETLCKAKELDPEIETGYILALGVGTYYDLPAADFFSVESTFITSGMVQQIHLRGKTVSAWTVNRAEDARDLLSLGVDDVITDKPEMVQDLLNEDADLDRNLVLMRDRLKELLGLTESADSEVDPDDSAIDEVLEDPISIHRCSLIATCAYAAVFILHFVPITANGYIAVRIGLIDNNLRMTASSCLLCLCVFFCVQIAF